MWPMSSPSWCATPSCTRAPSSRLRLVLDRTGFRVSVRDRRPGTFSRGPACVRWRGCSRSWGVLHFADGKSVWAHLPLERPHPAPARPNPVRALGAAARLGHRPAPAALRDLRPGAGPRVPAHGLRAAHPAPRGLRPRRLPPRVRRRRDEPVRGRARPPRHRRRGPVRSCRVAASSSTRWPGELHVGSRRDELSAAPGDVLLCDAATDVRLVVDAAGRRGGPARPRRGGPGRRRAHRVRRPHAADRPVPGGVAGSRRALAGHGRAPAPRRAGRRRGRWRAR